jgi:lambda family phage tail tape measure protein
MTTQTRIIRVQVDTKGDAKLSKISRDMGRLNKNVKQAANSVNTFKNAFRGLIASIGLRELARASDQFQLLRDRLKVFSDSAEDARMQFTQLIQAARLTRSSVNDLGAVFTRFKIATDGLGISNDAILATTIALQQSFRLSGASVAEAASATLQLSQAFSLGRLQGQELRAVLLSNSVLTRILREEFEGTGLSLKELGEQGRLTIDRVLNAILKNFKQLNTEAGGLGTTFGQTLTIAFDAFRLRVDKLNQSLNLSENFRKFTFALIDNLDIVGSAITSITTLIVAQSIPKIIASLKALTVAISTNPIGLLLSVIAGAITFLAFNWGKSLLRMRKLFLEFGLAIAEGIQKILKDFKPFEDFIGRIFKRLNILKNFDLDIIDPAKITKAKKEIADINMQLALLANQKDPVDSLFDKLNESLKDFVAPRTGVGTLAIIRELNRQFREGKIDILQYNEQIRKNEIEQLTLKFKEGVITIQEYNDGLTKASQGFTDLKGITAGVQQGLITVAQTTGNVATQISQGIQNTFKGLENVIVEFVKTGQFEFKKFTQSVLEDLTRIIVRASIISPLANAFVGSIGGSAGGTSLGSSSFQPSLTTRPAAKGAAISNGNILPFATGGIVNRPTFFPLRGNNIGLMGEAGAEAILPLERGRGGKLGVQASGAGVTVNIINNTDGEVSQQETTDAFGNKTVDIFIQSKVQEGFANGSFDKTLQQAFGLNRRAL